MYQVCIKYSLCDLFVTSSFAVFEATILVKSTHLIKSCLKTRKKGENMEIKEFVLQNLYLKDR